MIICPAMKIEGTPGFDHSRYLSEWERGRIPPSQGAVSFQDCLQCRHNRGGNEKDFTVECGFDPANVVNLESMPI
jgi:hypothetical protein